MLKRFAAKPLFFHTTTVMLHANSRPRRHPLRTSGPAQILPLKVSDTRPVSPVHRRRRWRLLVVLLLASSALVWLLYARQTVREPPAIEKVPGEHDLPPLYEAYAEYERRLPQHDLSLPFPEGRDAKFLWAANHVTASGWGNVMQELLLLAFLAHETNRAFVFDNFTFTPDGPDYVEWSGRLITNRIPLSVIISGPIIGSAFEPGDPTPRAVHKDYFKRVCPNPTIVDSETVVGTNIRYEAQAMQIYENWVDKLNSINDPCVEIHQYSPQLFDIWLFGSTRILSIWPRLSKSPILRNFSWSPLVLEAFARNAHLFGVKTKSFRFLPEYLWPSSAPPTSKELHNVEPILPAMKIDPIPGLIVLHIRRGDFADHCAHLANWASDFNGFSKFATLPDKFHPPPGGGGGQTTEENKQYYLERCFPSIERIVDKIRQILDERKKARGRGKELDKIYIMTNADRAWLEELKSGLMGIKKWKSVTNSRDLRLTWEDKPIAQAMDMLVGQRADVFIGNGFSSLTSNVVMFRMLRDLPPETTRFW